MRRFGFIVSGFGLWVIAGYMFYKNLIALDYMQDPSIWWAIIVPLGLLIVGAFPFIHGLTSDNIYNIKSGVVLAQDFTPRHYVQGTTTYTSSTVNGVTTMIPIIVPGHWEDDDWALKLQDEAGHTGWLHFASDVFSNYPVGTHYPRMGG
jgi:hypothetical protein